MERIDENIKNGLENIDEDIWIEEDEPASGELYDGEFSDEEDGEDYYEEDDAYESSDENELRVLIDELRETKKDLEIETEAAKAQKIFYERKNRPKRRGLFDSAPDPALQGKNLAERLGYDKEAKKNAKPSLIEKVIDKKIKSSKIRIIFYAVVGIVAFSFGIWIQFFVK